MKIKLPKLELSFYTPLFYLTQEKLLIGQLKHLDFIICQGNKFFCACTLGKLAFDMICRETDAADAETVAAPILRMTIEKPGLLSTYLSKLKETGHRFSAVLRERAVKAGSPVVDESSMPSILSGASVGCLIAAQEAWLASEIRPGFSKTLDMCVACIKPRSNDKSSKIKQ